MNERNPFQQLVDQNLSGLQWNERRKQKVLHAMDGERSNIHMKKKMTCIVALAVALCLMTGVALAVTLAYSERYSRAARANALLAEKAGITGDLLSFFTRTENDGIFRYQGMPELAGMAGDYLVDLETGEVKWLFDGPTASGWDAAKLAEALERCQTPDGNLQVMAEAREAAAAIGLTAQELVLPDTAALEAMLEAAATREATARAMAAISLTEAEALARAALQAEYGLSAEQLRQLDFVEEATLYTMEGDTPVVKPYFGLNQSEAGWTARDGIYIVTVNLLDGSIEAVIYDNALMGVG